MDIYVQPTSLNLWFRAQDDIVVVVVVVVVVLFARDPQETLPVN